MDEINQAIVDLKDSDEGFDWQTVYEIIKGDYPHQDLSEPAIRGRYYRHSSAHQSTYKPNIVGVQAREGVSVDKAIARAKALWRATLIDRERRKRQAVTFSGEGPICIMFMADSHAGSAGVNYDRLFEEADIISSTPDTHVVYVGDIVDQFVLQSMSQIRFHTSLTVPEEWAIARGLLELLAHKIIVSVAGNHDNWTNMLVGVDYFKDIVSQISPDALYGVHQVLFKLKVGDAEWRVKARHKWRGVSIHNPTLGIERAARLDGDFDVGIGGHTHVAGLCRPFVNAGKTGYAVLCGSPKEEDEFADRIGFPKSNESITVPLVFTPGQSIITFATVRDASDYMWSKHNERNTKVRAGIAGRQTETGGNSAQESGRVF